MKHKSIVFAVFSIVFSFSLLLSSCKRINEATTLGDGLIPSVDNITTFDTTLEVEAYNNIFLPTEDSISSAPVVAAGGIGTQFVGNIENDPLFGKTNAKMFLQLKPSSYKFLFSGKPKDSIVGLDSVVLVLGYAGVYGDSTISQNINVYEMATTNVFKYDSAYNIRENGFTRAGLLGSAMVDPRVLNDSIKTYQDTTAGQMRIKLDNAFGQRLLGYDTSNAYASDSAYSSYIRGFEVSSSTGIGNALIGFDIENSPNTKLAIYYRYKDNGATDTTVSYFTFNITSAYHNFIDRDITGSPYQAAASATTPANFVYLMNAPGGYAKIKIPGLSNLSNRLVHKAELIVEQAYDPSDANFGIPEMLYLDAYDSSISKYRPVPYDFSINSTTGQPDLFSFGSFGNARTDQSANPIHIWNFNLTRYVQNILTKKVNYFDLRLLTHRFINDQFETSGSNTNPVFSTYKVVLNSSYAVGRVRVKGGGTPATPQRMRLRIVYSKI